MKKTQRKDQYGIGKTLKIKTMFHIKKQKEIIALKTEIIALRKQYKDQQPTVIDRENGAAKIITTLEMLLETAVPVTEDDSISDADYYDQKSALRSSSTSRRTTHSIAIADRSDKLKKNQKTLLSFKQAESEKEPTLKM